MNDSIWIYIIFRTDSHWHTKSKHHIVFCLKVSWGGILESNEYCSTMSNMLAMCLTFVNIVTCMNSCTSTLILFNALGLFAEIRFAALILLFFFFSCNGKCENRIFKYLLNAQYTTETTLLLPLYSIARAHCVCHQFTYLPMDHLPFWDAQNEWVHVWVWVWVYTTTFWKWLSSSSYSKHIKLCATYLCINKLSQLHPHTI